MAITNSTEGIKSGFFAETLRIMSVTLRKNFRILFKPEVYFIIFQIGKNRENRKKEPEGIKSGFFAETLRSNIEKNFRIFFKPEVYFFIFPIGKN